MKRMVAITFLILLAAVGWGQNPNPEPLNRLKLDLWGIGAFASKLPYPEDFRFSLEYERKIPTSNHLALILDTEVRRNYIEFERAFQLPYIETPIWSGGWANQMNYALMPGLRYSAQFVKKNNLCWRGFADAKLEMVYRSSLFYPFISWGGTTKVSELRIAPRLRIGNSIDVTKHLGFEPSLELFKQKNMGNGSHTWRLAPELNIVVII